MAGLLLDLDGVVYVGEAAVPGAAEALAWLEREGVPYRYVTNTSSRPRSSLVAKLRGFAIVANTDDILTPAVVAARWMRREHLARPALFVPEATATEFAGFHLVPPTAEDGADAVVIGDLGSAWDFATLNRAFRLLMADPAVPLLALGTTRYWRAADGLRLDAGPFVRALESATGRTAVVLGKPDPAFYRTATDGIGLMPGDVVMVGDDVYGDVEGAQRAGLVGILVRTGKFTPADLETDVAPDAVLDSIADLPQWWAAHH
ncbi:TIGR01458 family HAD-type hydrolase [Agromyces sp. SYSU K20354]|uniref:TIGR01458 family HAD-type hydrolase n=1 Tax=Agromyces cavernae TaxID=2898659 RepID=UPI001E3BB2F8|nr:TIGR01458 family HAD-type hydrolase [Agromyces cavernae]MCD2442300.1 TIGR01458 family HAD-type hydrolase [Agromyces cavernae]